MKDDKIINKIFEAKTERNTKSGDPKITGKNRYLSNRGEKQHGWDVAKQLSLEQKFVETKNKRRKNNMMLLYSGVEATHRCFIMMKENKKSINFRERSISLIKILYLQALRN